jgi:Raf kinase inhibitor-like YbhB/YbcL family protein
MALVITSTAFGEGDRIPARFTAAGQDISPALAWSGAPAATAAFALVLHDPDAPRPGGFTHWVIFNLPAAVKGLSEGISATPRLETGASQGKNSAGANGYMGPAPPPGKPHHYHFRLYALDKKLDLPPSADRQRLLEAIKGHVLAESDLVGIYQR